MLEALSTLMLVEVITNHDAITPTILDTTTLCINTSGHMEGLITFRWLCTNNIAAAQLV
jgi:hypothetical protein